MVRETWRTGNAARKKVGRADAPRKIVHSEMEKSCLCYTSAYAFREARKETLSRGRDGLHLPRIFRADGATAQPVRHAHESSVSFRADVEALDA